MGWTFMREPLRGMSPEGFLADQYSMARNEDGERQDVIRRERRGGVVFLALNVTHATRPAYITAVVVLIQESPGGFGWKSIDEAMGPMEAGCSPEFLASLSPVAELPRPGYAQNWRDRAVAAHAPV